ncbi:hypothetical protein BCO18175_07121 [Burkholderia contaminans]|nr:hypothetical protein BCO18175_07121 [Burkholderia contaminans]
MRKWTAEQIADAEALTCKPSTIAITGAEVDKTRSTIPNPANGSLLQGTLSMTKTKFAVAAAFALTYVHASAACDGASNMPGHYIDIVFDTDSSAISSAELSRLSEWSIDMHKRFPIIDTVWLNGLAERTEHDAQQLATRRAESVMSVLDQYSIHGENRALAGKIFKPDKFDQSGRRVEVNVSPGCPNHCCPNLNPIPKTQ